MNRCYLSLGSNQKNPERQIRQAIKTLSRNIPRTRVVKVSSLHWTKAWGLQAQQDFCNVALDIATNLPPYMLLKYCQELETSQGRVRKRRWGPRTLDVDIILYGNKKINSPKLIVPHPYFLQRDFVLKPLQEICTLSQVTATLK